MKILNVAKAALYGIFLNYYCFYVLAGRFIPGGTILFLGVALLCVGWDVWHQRYVYVGTEVKCWLLYAALSFATTMFITMGSGDTGFVGDIIKHVQRVAIIMAVAYICEREGSTRFGLQLMAVTAIALAISVISVTGDINRKLDITSGASLSANDTGAILAFGCFAVLFAWGKRENASMTLSVIKIAGVICCIAVIFLAGSRKSITAVLIMMAVLLVLCFPDYSRKISAKKVMIVLIIGIAAYLFVTKNLLPHAQQTNLYDRLFGDNAAGAASSDQIRIDLYKWALEAFLEHPFFGLGFNQYVKYHGNYTHSTYAEPLACSGMLGLVYLYPYFLIIKKQLHLIRRTPFDSYARLKQKEIFAYLCMFLFVAVGIPYMYKDAPCIVLGTLIGHQAISFRELRKTGKCSGDY